MDTVKYKNKYRIATIRLKNYDYSQNGCYFVTICTKDKQKYFGNIENEKMVLNEIGEIVEKFWLEIPKHFPSVVLDEFVIMPNHVHGIIIINKLADEMPTLFAVETRHCLVSTTEKINRFQNQGKNTISSIIGSYKSICTKIINQMQNKKFFVWQSRFYDRIIRDEKELNNIRQYISNNPIKSQYDDFIS